MQYKVVFFGKSGSGKTQLHRIAGLQNFVENVRPTIAADFLTREINSDDSVLLWDTSGAERYKAMSHMFFRGAVVGVFCIDLTEEINEQEIIKSIEEFRHFVPNAPIICVGTKLDSPEADKKALDKIKSKVLFADFITTSASTGENVEDLFKLICKHCGANLLLSWKEAVATLQKSLNELPQKKGILINEKLTTLADVILGKPGNPSASPRLKAKAIEDFTNQCKTILKDEHSDAFKAVLSIAAAAVVLTVTAIIGFSIGVACSWWTGPGAFFAGLASGYTAAVAVASSSTVFGALAGGITAYGLFKPPKEIQAINEFAETVSSFDPGIVL
ncbi:GTP-binding protein [Fluoribacter gormanii]|uniref:Rab family GTPase n=1 Tax=Fluoribacter gormanii TaxID=464 RepID=UPI002244DCDD|nr:Rab family GTPase [Fluoribacter gormanii]MCW8443688.1 GTP-binding protein [Fluoribacter gormanii]